MARSFITYVAALGLLATALSTAAIDTYHMTAHSHVARVVSMNATEAAMRVPGSSGRNAP